MRHGPAEDEAARLDAGDLVDLHAGPWLHHFVDRAAESARIAEQRGDVTEHDAGLGIVRDRADGVAQIVFEGAHRGGYFFIRSTKVCPPFILS